MESLVTELAKQVPALVVLVFVVVRFLGYLSVLEERREKLDSIRIDTLQNLGDACHDFQRDMMIRFETAMRKTDMALERNSDLLSRHNQALDRLEDYLDSRAPSRK